MISWEELKFLFVRVQALLQRHNNNAHNVMHFINEYIIIIIITFVLLSSL